MPDLKETFDLVTRQIEPDLDARDDQMRRQRRVARNRKVGASSVAAAILVLALAAFLTFAPIGEPGDTNTGNAPLSTPGHPPSTPFFLDLRTGEMTPVARTLLPADVNVDTYVNYSVSPDGSELAYSTCLSFACSSADVMRVGGIDGSGARSVPVPEGLNGYRPRWSPIGTSLVYQLRDGGAQGVGDLYLHDLSTGHRTRLTDLELVSADWWFLAPSFSPDGQSVVFHLPRETDALRWDVWTVPVVGGEPTLLVREATYPVYFPDGAIAFVKPAVSDPTGQRLEMVDADGSRRTLVEANSHLGISWPAISPDGNRIAYQDGGSIYVLDVGSGESSEVAVGDNAEWLDDHTLIVSPVLRADG